ncbi:hypothetical protein K4G60_g4300 [Candida parapsilosis]|nr:hypothetical protein K4G60_g4300 [Candida parapsilosis]
MCFKITKLIWHHSAKVEHSCDHAPEVAAILGLKANSENHSTSMRLQEAASRDLSSLDGKLTLLPQKLFKFTVSVL